MTSRVLAPAAIHTFLACCHVSYYDGLDLSVLETKRSPFSLKLLFQSVLSQPCKVANTVVIRRDTTGKGVSRQGAVWFPQRHNGDEVRSDPWVRRR